MGTEFKLVFYAPGDSAALGAAKKAFRCLDLLNSVMSDYQDGSELNRLSQLSGSGYWIRTGKELYAVLDSSIALSSLTKGAFDPTIGPVTLIWRKAALTHRFPQKKELRKASRKTGYRKIETDRALGLIRLNQSGMRLDLGGIGKGFAADLLIRILEAEGISSAMVDAGGDLVVSGPPPGQTGWRISVSEAGPKTDDRILTLAYCGIATSGATYRYIEHKGKKYSHIVDPRSGKAGTRHLTVTVIAPNGTRADALATGISVLGLKRGKKLVRNNPGIDVSVTERSLRNENTRTWESPGFMEPESSRRKVARASHLIQRGALENVLSIILP